MKAKLLSLLSLIVLSTGIICADKVQIGDLYYTLNEDELTASVAQSGDSYAGLSEIVIPASVTYNGVQYSVKLISMWALSYCVDMVSLTIPNSLIDIGMQALAGNINLTSITVEAGNPMYDSRDNCNAVIQTATNTLVAGCKTTVIPSSVTSIGLDAFNSYSSLTSIDIPSSVTSIGSQAFYGCSGLSSLTIPSSVTSIVEGAFAKCSGLTSITVEARNTAYDSRDNCNAIIETATNTLVAGCPNTIIPSGITSIGKQAFSHCTGLTSITIPSSVTSIGDYVFSDCSGLTSIDIPSGVTSIGAGSFSGCSGLTSITCRAVTPPSLGNSVFDYTVDTSIPVYVPSESIEAYQAAAQWKSFTNIQAIAGGDQPYTGKVEIDGLYYNLDGSTLTAEVAVSDNNYDGLTDVIIPASVSYNNIEYSVTSIGNNAFAFCNTLTSVDIPSSVTSIGTQAFATCPYLKSVVIPSSVTIIGNQAFMACDSLVSITIPDGVTSIGNYTFHNCLALTTIDIPSGVTSIGKSAFDNCLGFTSITCRAVYVPELGTDAFNRVDKSIPLYVPSESIAAYQAASGWSDFTNIKAIPSGGGEVQIAMAVAANQWTFICLPPLGDRQYTEDMFTYDGLTGVQWGTYNGAKRAAGQSGWETPETFNALQGYIIYSTTAGTLRIDAYEDDIRQGETADSISTPLNAYDSDLPANTGWNILGNPYNQGFPISAFADAGIESPITVWNGTGYTTYTPGIDDYTLQPFEAFFIQKAEGGAERITFRREDLERDVEGALSGYFSVGESTKVRFSQGNLQYQASTQTWRFAENQYDMIGNDNANISDSYSGWIDLFGFGTGDNPTKSISNYSDYSTFTDWGTNAISNGGNEANLWRTLTTDEWLYLFYSRTDAANLFGLGSVNGVSGLIILPDNWTTPQGASFTPSTTQGLVDTGVYFSNTNGDNFSHNTYTAEQWLVMEQSGAVFLPVTGYRWGTGMDYVGTTGYYWSTTPYNEGYVRSLYFDSNYFYPQGNNDRYLGLSVRLVR